MWHKYCKVDEASRVPSSDRIFKNKLGILSLFLGLNRKHRTLNTPYYAIGHVMIYRLIGSRTRYLARVVRALSFVFVLGQVTIFKRMNWRPYSESYGKIHVSPAMLTLPRKTACSWSLFQRWRSKHLWRFLLFLEQAPWAPFFRKPLSPNSFENNSHKNKKHSAMPPPKKQEK